MIAKNSMSVFMLNVLNYITVSRVACQVFLRLKKKKFYTKKWFSIFLSLSIHNCSNRTQSFIRSNKNIFNEILNYFFRYIIYAWEKWQKNHSIYNYIWSFSVHIYTYRPDPGLKSNRYNEKRAEVLGHPFVSKKIIFLHYLLETNKISKN